MIVLGTRGSDLALTQSRHVGEAVQAATGEPFRLEIIRTRGDAILDKPLPLVGGKGLFTAELEEALREGRIDFAVHSLKDLPVEDPAGLTLGAIPPRAPVHDVLVYDPAHHDPEGGTLPLADGRRLGTSSPRRAAAAACLRKDLVIADVRGNVPTRADKVRRGDYHAVLLAAAGLERLALPLDGLARAELPVDRFVPAPGQGALGVQCRRDDQRVLDLLAAIHDPVTARCVHAERAVLSGLGGGCSTPLGALATPLPGGDGFRLLAALFTRNGSPAHRVLYDRCGDDLDVLVGEAVSILRRLATEPLRDRRVCVVRPGGEDSGLTAHLAVAGAQVELVATTEALPVHAAEAELDALLACPAFALTSARAVDRLFEEAARRAVDLGTRRFFAVGPATAAALAGREVVAEVPDEPAGGAALAAHVLASDLPADAALGFPCAQDPHPALADTLRAAGRTLQQVALYRIAPLPGVQWPDAGSWDALLFTSPSAVHAAPADPPPARHVLALGDSTARSLAERGLDATTAARPDPAAVVDLLANLPATTA